MQLNKTNLWSILKAAGLATSLLATTATLGQDAPEEAMQGEQIAAPAPEAQEQDAPLPVFFHVEMPQGATPYHQAISTIAARPDLNLLRKAQVGTKLLLNVSAANNLRMTVIKTEHRPDGTFSIRGTLDGLQGTTVMMAVQEDALASDVVAPPLQLHYKTKYAVDGVHMVCEMDDGKYATCGNTPVDDGSDNDPGVPEAWEEATGGVPLEVIEEGFGERGSCTTEVVFDQMIIYTDVARIAAGGTSAIQAECQLAIDRTNESYDNSPISARIRLVRRYEISYNEVGTYDDHLDNLTGTNGMGGAAPWTTARTNRDTYNADFATLFVDDGQYCGLAWCTSAANRGYSVVTWSCAAGNLSHPHELGHNQGCGHDIANGGCGYSAYAYGWRFDGSDNVEYRTVMAYAPGIRIPYFSNPSQTYLGTATGNAATADNERVIEERKAVCEDFESTRWDIFIDSAFAGIEIGTNANPYNTVTEGVTNIDDWVTGASEYPNLYLKSNFNYIGTISKEMTIDTCGADHTLGTP